MPFFHLVFEMKQLAELPTVCTRVGFQLPEKAGAGLEGKGQTPWDPGGASPRFESQHG